MKIYRNAAVAGVFYPGEKEGLVREVDSYLKAADEPPRGAIAVVSPHAGYIYSGGVAGELMGLLEVPDRVVLLGPKHTRAGAKIAVSQAEAWRFPFGDVPVDTELAKLVVRKTHAVYDDAAHLEEHSLEVQIPFLWRRNPKIKITPILVGMHRFEDLKALGRDLSRVIKRMDEPVLIVASTDMSHQIPQTEAERLDNMAIKQVMELKPQGLYETVMEHRISMCGVVPTTVALVAAKRLGAGRVNLVRYATSGEVTGDLRSVVGYAGLTIR